MACPPTLTLPIPPRRRPRPPTPTPTPLHPRPLRQGHEFASNEELKAAADLHCADRAAADRRYGRIERWRTSRVTSMRELFEDKAEFNGDVSGWDVSNVVDMYCMFRNAAKFNGDLSKWSVGRVTNMYAMFYNARSFNGDVSGWAVGGVTNRIGMRYMFAGARSFGRTLGGAWAASGADKTGMFDDGCPGKIAGMANDGEGTPQRR